MILDLLRTVSWQRNYIVVQESCTSSLKRHQIRGRQNQKRPLQAQLPAQLRLDLQRTLLQAMNNVIVLRLGPPRLCDSGQRKDQEVKLLRHSWLWLNPGSHLPEVRRGAPRSRLKYRIRDARSLRH